MSPIAHAGTPSRLRRVLCALAAGGAYLALSTEALSAAGAFRRGPLIVLWFPALALTAAFVVRPATPKSAPSRPDVFEMLLAAAIGAIALVTAVTALASPPNSVDAFGYHLSRVIYWMQAGSVDFFPTHYFNQISMPPFAEYAMAHAWLLGGSDRLVNLVQWVAFIGCLVCAPLIAAELGAGRRGRFLAAFFCATLPNGILQASGAKNDCVLALWLASMLYFALCFAREPGKCNAFWLGVSLGLALLTKGTAWVFAPTLLAGAGGVAAWRHRGRYSRAVPLIALCVLAINAPQWWRNIDFSGSILGPASAQADGRYRWTNANPGPAATISNVLRNASQQLGARPDSWNRGIYKAVLAAHRVLRLDVDDPASTWPGTRFAPPVNSNHEADAPNRWHLLLLAAAAIPVLWSRRREWLIYYTGLVLAFLFFCAALRYQPYLGRLFLPLFVAGAPLAGVLGERIRPTLVQVAMCLLLADGARHPLLDNWTRPLRGPAGIFRTTRNENYFRDIAQFEVTAADYRRAAGLTAASGCSQVGIDNEFFQLEYPFQVLVLERNPHARFVHTGVMNASAKYAVPQMSRTCAVLCLGCAGVTRKIEQYRALGEPVVIGRFLLYGIR